eukprot:scaffold64380_cov60-Phaeocystis_antarctica.AAC.4
MKSWYEVRVRVEVLRFSACAQRGWGVLCVTDQASWQEFESILKTFSSFVSARCRFADALPSAALGPGRAPLSARPCSWRSKAALSAMHLATLSNILATTSALSNASAGMLTRSEAERSRAALPVSPARATTGELRCGQACDENPCSSRNIWPTGYSTVLSDNYTGRGRSTLCRLKVRSGPQSCSG